MALLLLSFVVFDSISFMIAFLIKPALSPPPGSAST